MKGECRTQSPCTGRTYEAPKTTFQGHLPYVRYQTETRRCIAVNMWERIKGPMVRALQKGNHMQGPTSEQDQSAHTGSVKRRLADMCELLGQVPATANDNGVAKQLGNAPSELQPPRRALTCQPLGTIG